MRTCDRCEKAPISLCTAKSIASYSLLILNHQSMLLFFCLTACSVPVSIVAATSYNGVKMATIVVYSLICACMILKVTNQEMKRNISYKELNDNRVKTQCYLQKLNTDRR